MPGLHCESRLLRSIYRIPLPLPSPALQQLRKAFSLPATDWVTSRQTTPLDLALPPFALLYTVSPPLVPLTSKESNHPLV